VSKTISAAKTTTTARARRMRMPRVDLRTFGLGQGAPAAAVSFPAALWWHLHPDRSE
jgi:hypothetical protein